MWRELIYTLTDGKCEFHEPATQQEISEVEDNLGAKLPQNLRSLLLETNGVSETLLLKDVLEPISLLIGSTAWIMQWNKYWRTEKFAFENYMPLESLLFFAPAGVDGILFAFGITSTKQIINENIYAWYPIEDSRPCVAFSLADYLERWCIGKLSL